MGVFFVELDGVGEAIGIVKGVGEVDIGVLMLFDGFDDAGEFIHDELHPLHEFVVVLVVLSVGEPLKNRVLIIRSWEYGGDIDAFCQERVLYLAQL